MQNLGLFLMNIHADRSLAYPSSIPQWQRLLVISYLALVFLLTSWWSYVGIVAENPYKLGDWLINYSAGFVRRGFTGSFFFWLESITGLSPSSTIFIVQVGSYLIYFAFAGSLLLRQKSILPYLLLLLSPYVFTFQLSDVGGGYRKEILFLALMATTAWTSRYLSTRSFRAVMLATALIYPLLVLSHEMLAAFLPYLVAIYVIRVKPNIHHLIIVTVALIPSATAFGFAVAYPVTPELVDSMCQGLTTRFPDICSVNGAIDWLDTPLRSAMEQVQYRVESERFLPIYSLSILLGIIAFIPILGRFTSLLKYPIAAVLTGISLFGTLVMFPVVLDWGRLIYVNLAALFLLSLVIPVKQPTQQPSDGWLKALDLLVGKSPPSRLAFTLLILIAFGYSCFWRIPHIANAGTEVVVFDRPIYMAKQLWWSIDRLVEERRN